MYKVVNTKDNPEYLPILQGFCKTITGHRSENYINLNVDNALIWYILYVGPWIVGFSGIQVPRHLNEHRLARIMYRTYLAPEVRGEGLIPSRLNWIYSGEQQIKYCLDNGYTPFISREDTGNLNASRNILKVLDEKYGKGTWNLIDKKIWTCNSDPSDNPKCWQRLIVKGDAKVFDQIKREYIQE